MKKILPYLLTGFILLGLGHFLTAQELYTDSQYESEETIDDSRFGMGLGIKMSTFGPGVEVIAAVTPKLHLRLGGTYMDYTYHYSDKNVEVNGSAESHLSSISLLANYQLARIFFVSGGFLYNMNEIGLDGFFTKSMTVGSMEVSPEKIGSVNLKIKPGSSLTPYAGIGLGRSLSKNGIVSFAFELGAAFHGSPKVELGATGMLEPTGSEEQRQILEDNLSGFTIYPMLNFQLSFRLL
ncbi:MAG: hypothetical protein RBR87_06480 [Bacteroidales bacterium]|jgi:hypothetical protein|nr:hypothetical protein [Bacteroidales bacterium]